MASSPIARPRGTTDKRRTTTTNSSSSHHHDGAPSRPYPLICIGAEPIHPVHCPHKLPAWPWPPETRSFFCNFGGVYFFVVYKREGRNMAHKLAPPNHTCHCIWHLVMWCWDTLGVGNYTHYKLYWHQDVHTRIDVVSSTWGFP